MSQINNYKEKFLTLLESKTGNLKPIILEQSTQETHNGREIKINPSTDTMMIKDKNGKLKSLKFNAMGIDIKLRSIKKIGTDFEVCGVKTCKKIQSKDVDKIITDVDKGLSKGVVDGGFLSPNLNYTIS